MKRILLPDRHPSSGLAVFFALFTLLALCTPTVYGQLVNTAFGTNALHSNTTGNYNAAFGNSALYSNTTGSANSAVGFDTLYSNVSGNYNNASGLQALYSNTTGSLNTATGVYTLFSTLPAVPTLPLG